MDGRVFYGRCGALLGYKVLPSTMFTVAPDAGGGYRFAGHGIGHGIGMCQWGARGRADAGMDAAAILAAYFPGTAAKLA
jgi:SpoIID/LytB domain protein